MRPRHGATDDPRPEAIPSATEADRVESAAIASSKAEPTPADTVPLGAVPATSKRRAAGSKKTLMAGLAAAATVVAIAIAVLLPSQQPTAAAEPAAADVYVPPPSSGPAPGLLVVTAAPWGQVTRLSGAEGTPVELPTERTTPLRLWVAPGLHHAEVTLAGGAVATCAVDVLTGGTHLCAATAVDEGAVPDGTDYFKEMGWWQ